MDEMPMISRSTYVAAPLNLVDMATTAVGVLPLNMSTTAVDPAVFGVRGEQGPRGDPGFDYRDAARAMAEAHNNARRVMTDRRDRLNFKLPTEETMASQRRLVQVVIVDPDENVPIEQCLLHHGEPKLTDATDQELFFEIDIKRLLDAHNEKRVKLTNKKVKERVEQLEPAKIRDLRMAVVEIARFY
jgi:hypothetical protein